MSFYNQGIQPIYGGCEHVGQLNWSKQNSDEISKMVHTIMVPFT